ncbi:MAG: hypothetical protein CMJ76_15595 [Planctomycetaceae bacterium]|nr:hypothetical protein [Planctomycetaceae bacterium]
MLIAAVILKLGLIAARNPESGLHKAYSIILAIIRYPLWIFTAFIGGALIMMFLSFPDAGEFAVGGILLGSFLLFVGVMGIIHAIKSHKREKNE